MSAWLERAFADAPINHVPSLDRPTDPPRLFIGVDLAQVSDYTAVAIVEQHGRAGEAVYHVRHLERIERGTSYPLIVQHIATLARQPSIAERSALVVDQTGVGRAVVDLIRAEQLRAQLVPVTITGGDSAHRGDTGWLTPKRDLVASVQVLLQTQRLKVAPALASAALLTEELEAFQVKLSPSGMDSYGAWREGTHDDLVLSVALAVWAGERGIGAPLRAY